MRRTRPLNRLMSLKARLRLAVALLMSAVVLIVSGLYIHSNLNAALGRAEATANSVADQVRSAVQEQLQREAAAADPPITDSERAKKFWIDTVAVDPVIGGSLARAVTYWPMLAEVFVTDEGGLLLASSRPERDSATPSALPRLAEWNRRSLFDNLWQIYADGRDMEVLRPIGVVGENKPILVVHTVVSSVMIKAQVSSSLHGLVLIGVTSLAASLFLALVLPFVVLNPLERLSRRLDLMTKDTFPDAAPANAKESKEFAAVYSKLDLLGQRYLGVREDVNQLRGNIEQLLARLEEAVLLFDARGRLTMAGPAVERLLGESPLELLGRTVEQVFPPWTEIGAAVLPAVRAGETINARAVNADDSNGTMPLFVSVQPLVDPGRGGPAGALIKLRDARTHGELAERLDVGGRLAALSQLTRGVAHEIKNPLNAIRLHIEVLRGRLQQQEENTPELDVIAGEISRLDRVVKTFLDFNRPVEPQFRSVDLNGLVKEIVALVSPDAGARGIGVEVRLWDAPALIRGDIDLLKQAVLNVVMNAVEAMSEKGGTLSLAVTREDGLVQLTVEDTGPGIAPELQNKIFNLYYTTKHRGSGMGLALAYRFVQLHDGRIEFSSRVGSGTTFRFSFPEATSNPNQSDLELSRTHRA